MQLPDSVKAIRSRYVAKFPVPQGNPSAEGTDIVEDRVRQWSIGLAEQVAFELPNQGWGTKRADPGRPISKDGLALREDDDRGGRLLIFDMVTGAGTGNGRLVENPESEDITGQVFVPVTPTDHLGVAPVQPPKPGPQPLPPADLGPVMAKLQSIENTLEALMGQTTIFTQMADERQKQILGGQTQIVGLLDALDKKEVHVTPPDGTLRIGGRAVGQVDFPGN
jgi:hypothetical protein